jgi:5-methylcytosine-specific restriction endonuclease McrBC regulatory subunit McrC
MGEFAMYVGCVITREGGRQMLIDTKYKRLRENRPHAGLSQSDFYQIHALRDGWQ